ncbi:carboxymuconolactone decarboxylase family protein [Arthrobacter sp. NPDC090010]|uniref:carboxymuconolactone decarboxylase family protein n=1 Tax=Arthrobacter sp. NPDC090010 TaxID=3363942 RepID=UPI0037F4ACBE
MTATPSRYERGKALMDRILGPEDASTVLDGFNAISPDFGNYVVEAGFADIYGRDGLSLPERQLLNIAILTALGGAEPQLALHMRAALNVGVSPTQIIESVIHTALYAGHPRAVNGLRVASEVLAQAQHVSEDGSR